MTWKNVYEIMVLEEKNQDQTQIKSSLYLK